MKKIAIPVLTVAGLCLATSAGFAQHAGDIELEVVDGKIVAEHSVYGAEFGEFGPSFTDDPGFDSGIGAFPVPSQVGFNFLDALRKWNGSDFYSLADERLQLSKGLFSELTPLLPGFAPGFSLPVAVDGSWHHHLDFNLQAPASPGIYLLTLELFSTAPEIAKSDPLFIVFQQPSGTFGNYTYDDEAHELAILWVENNLVSAVPEPATLVLAIIAAVVVGGMAIRRRREARR